MIFPLSISDVALLLASIVFYLAITSEYMFGFRLLRNISISRKKLRIIIFILIFAFVVYISF
jgi:hypothetical protein